MNYKNAGKDVSSIDIEKECSSIKAQFRIPLLEVSEKHKRRRNTNYKNAGQDTSRRGIQSSAEKEKHEFIKMQVRIPLLEVSEKC